MKKTLVFGSILAIFLLIFASFPSVIGGNIEKSNIVYNKLQEIRENIELKLLNPEPLCIFGIIPIIFGAFWLFFLVFIIGINPHG